MQKQGKLKNRKPFLQTKAQKNDKIDKCNGESWTTRQHGRDSFRTKKSQHTADFEKGTRKSPQNPSRLLKTLLLYH